MKLTDPHWNDLQDAYGDATPVPQLLEQVIADKHQRVISNLGRGSIFGLDCTTRAQFTLRRMQPSP